MSRQLQHSSLGLSKIDTLDKVKAAIELINLQGEGSNLTPEETPGDLAHYYRFGEIYHEKQFVKDAVTGKWSFSGPDVPLPQVWPMAEIPAGGYQRADVPDLATWDLIAMFDDQYSQMLRALQSAWQQGDPVLLGKAIRLMLAMGDAGAKLVLGAWGFTGLLCVEPPTASRVSSLRACSPPSHGRRL